MFTDHISPSSRDQCFSGLEILNGTSRFFLFQPLFKAVTSDISFFAPSRI